MDGCPKVPVHGAAVRARRPMKCLWAQVTPHPGFGSLSAPFAARPLDLLCQASATGLGQDGAAMEVVVRLQRVANDLGKALEALPGNGDRPAADPIDGLEPAPSREAAAALTLGCLTVPAGAQPVEQADRWVRILRLFGRVGDALDGLGVPEAPLATLSERSSEHSDGGDSQRLVVRWSGEFARRSGARTLDTVHVAFAVRKVFGSGLDRALYRRGASWDELTAGLVSEAGVRIAS